MADHPIQGLMKTAMENIRDMVDVNTIVGDPVETPDGSVIMPISKVGFGFAAGGSEFVTDSEGGPTAGAAHQGATNQGAANDANHAKVALPFGGGSGGGISITPIAFLVVGQQGVRVVPLDNQTHLFERLIDSAPQVVDKIQSMIKGNTSTAAASPAPTPPPATPPAAPPAAPPKPADPNTMPS
ncbi:GerW family sporulation protein [Paenibacillus sp. J2TS4]|uniref:GerW family sporulation protein n=1 Tax=Paenibacillus sp. J2TS4 TaxID=2807194 RepID=UPI001B21D21C|nr:GerW family sporulation protein [Paenibacillus sp. J2TS4]GIP32341.1 putative spore protein YtfJ [Paenibacillus sp. J2TS4]